MKSVGTCDVATVGCKVEFAWLWVLGSGFEIRVREPSFSAQGSGFRVQGSEFRSQGSEFQVYDLEFRVQWSGNWVPGSGFRVESWELGIYGLGFGVYGFFICRVSRFTVDEKRGNGRKGAHDREETEPLDLRQIEGLVFVC